MLISWVYSVVNFEICVYLCNFCPAQEHYLDLKMFCHAPSHSLLFCHVLICSPYTQTNQYPNLCCHRLPFTWSWHSNNWAHMICTHLCLVSFVQHYVYGNHTCVAIVYFLTINTPLYNYKKIYHSSLDWHLICFQFWTIMITMYL